MGSNWQSQIERKAFKSVSHVLFDMDGLLINTEVIYTRTIETILERYIGPTELSWEVKKKQMGKIAPDLAELIIEEYNLPLKPREYTAQARIIQENLFPHCEMMPGAERLIRHLKANNIPIALATSSAAETFRMKSTYHRDFFKLFDHHIYGSSDPELKRGKPHPDIFLTCASRFPDPPAPEKCLVFEDAPNGVKAALSAGMQVVMVPDPRMDEESRSEATLSLDSLLEFRPELFGLPPFDD
ncbi:pseudouridine-5'-phosphatase-like isoform X1 [Artemia franciscana]|uniref:pseudouridine-5'-phosphatase-like isoform X1 n=1 Tax=Artemia franciscana TaxID=6661 RepID=UPI0032DBDA1A